MFNIMKRPSFVSTTSSRALRAALRKRRALRADKSRAYRSNWDGSCRKFKPALNLTLTCEMVSEAGFTALT